MKKLTVVQVCFIALSAVINIIGGNLALVLRLPIYLDSIGTFLASALLGPVGGVLAGVVSGVISGITTDIYSLYFIPVQIVTGEAAGVFFLGHFVCQLREQLSVRASQRMCLAE